MMSASALKAFDKLTNCEFEIRNSVIGDWFRRCDVSPTPVDGCTIRVYRDTTLEFSYQMRLQLHPQHGYPVLAIEAQSADGRRVAELLVKGRHIENLRDMQIQHHFFYTYGRLCSPKPEVG